LPDPDSSTDSAFLARLATRVTELRLAIDLGEITTPADFKAALERGGAFTLDDVRVWHACAAASLGRWLG
jgi:hypothetical protein